MCKVVVVHKGAVGRSRTRRHTSQDFFPTKETPTDHGGGGSGKAMDAAKYIRLRESEKHGENSTTRENNTIEKSLWLRRFQNMEIRSGSRQIH
jgi:hypothetical protein